MSGAPCLMGLVGVSGSGKDTAADYLRQRYGFRRIAFADPLKGWVRTIFALSDEQLWGAGRDRLDDRLGLTPREVYQRFGDFCREIDPDVLLRSFRSATEAALAAGDRVVCTDVRTRAEFDLLRADGWRVYRMVRPGAGAPGSAGEHGTETELSAVADTEFDGILHNAGTVAELHAQLDLLMRGPT